MEQSEPSYIAVKDGNWYNFLGKLYAISVKLNLYIPQDPATPLLEVYTQHKWVYMETKRHEQE